MGFSIRERDMTQIGIGISLGLLNVAYEVLLFAVGAA